MKLRGAFFALALMAAASASCTIVAPGGPDGGTKIIPLRPDALPQPRSLSASVLYVVNLQRSSANLSEQYAQIMIGLASYLQSVGLALDNMGAIATYADRFGPRLLLGRRAENGPGPSLALLLAAAAAGDAGIQDYERLLPFLGGALGNVSDEDLPVALKVLAASGNFDGQGETSEGKNLIAFGRGLHDEPLPAQLGGIHRDALFDRPRDLFLVVHLQPLPRRCALGSEACRVEGQDVASLLTAVGVDGGLTWLRFSGGQTIQPGRVVHVSIATTEGEDLAAFRNRCSRVAGFPKNLFDVIAPSPAPYFDPLMASIRAVHGGNAHTADFCELIGSSPEDAIKRLGNGVAAVAVSAPSGFGSTTSPPLAP
jgi:hypothetical protein